MLNCNEFFDLFRKEDLTYFCGVPDSTFKGWMSFLDDKNGVELTNRIAVIERDAVGFAAGYYVSTGKIGVVYMQNSGLGNSVNPLTSLADNKVYNIPMLLMIGWRGEPGKPDEPQHAKMGEVTIPILDVLGIKHCLLPDNLEEAAKVIKYAKKHMEDSKEVFAIVIKEGVFGNYKKTVKNEQKINMKREDAIKIIVDELNDDELIIATTGKTSRELFEYREAKGQGHENDFLMVGAMGLASAFGAEIALQRPKEKVYVLDGDGAFLMSEGVLSTIGFYSPKNFYHIVIDNSVHDSTGGQPTTSASVDFQKTATAHSYKSAETVRTTEDLKAALKKLKSEEGPSMLVVKVDKGSRENLGRPTTTPIQNKKAFMERLDRVERPS
ncbi:MAG: phosphonopyruvate decarboxylase [Deltaproteobacteria bacterium]